MSKNTEAVAAADLTTIEGVVAATRAIATERTRVTAGFKRSEGNLMELAAPVVAAAFAVGVVTNDGGAKLVTDPDKEVQTYPLGVRAYAKSLGYSHTYVAKLARLGRALDAGIVEPGSAESQAIRSNGSSAPFAFLDGDLTDVKSDAVTKADAETKEAAKAAAKAKRDEAKAAETRSEADEANDGETAAEAFARYIGAATTLTGSLKGAERVDAMAAVEALAALLAPKVARRSA